MIFPQMVMKRHYQVVEHQTQVAERRSVPFRLNLTTDCRADIDQRCCTDTMSETWAAELSDVRCPLPDMTALSLSSFQLADIPPAVSP